MTSGKPICPTCNSDDPMWRIDSGDGMLCPNEWHPMNRPQTLDLVPGWGINAEDGDQFRARMRAQCVTIAAGWRGSVGKPDVVIRDARLFEAYVMGDVVSTQDTPSGPG